MTATSIAVKLEQLRQGDRVTFDDLQWQVKDYSTYQDKNNYQTQEWLLQSGKIQRYLLREVDPQHPENLVHWYLAREINSAEGLITDQEGYTVATLLSKMLRQDAPYEELTYQDTTYYLESQTKGTYQTQKWQDTRITWDYWDEEHQVNLAFEAWRDGELHVYLSQEVNPEDFSQLKIAKKNNNTNRLQQPRYSLILEAIMASGLIIAGIVMIIFYYLNHGS